MLVCNGRQLLPIFLVPRQFPEIVSTVQSKSWKYKHLQQQVLLVLCTIFFRFQVSENKVDQICNKNQL